MPQIRIAQDRPQHAKIAGKHHSESHVPASIHGVYNVSLRKHQSTIRTVPSDPSLPEPSYFVPTLLKGYDEVMRLTSNRAASKPPPRARTCKLPESERESTKDDGAASVRG